MPGIGAVGQYALGQFTTFERQPPAVAYAETVVQAMSSKTATTQFGADVAIRPASAITAVE
jgi:hypothetical protein